jgi:hypothetical protein
VTYISHRGNIYGPIPKLENSPNYINDAIYNGFDVEIDIWFEHGNFYLGHDLPQYQISIDWILDRRENLWIHCKNINSIITFNNVYRLQNPELNYFWHQTDTVTFTSLSYLWAYPTKVAIPNSICVLPEWFDTDTKDCIGVCSDYIYKYKNEII